MTVRDLEKVTMGTPLFVKDGFSLLRVCRKGDDLVGVNWRDDVTDGIGDRVVSNVKIDGVIGYGMRCLIVTTV